MLTICPLFLANSSYGFTISTISYHESKQSFTWKFQWDGNTDKTETPAYTPPPESNNKCLGVACWTTNLTGIEDNNVITALVFSGQHFSRAHTGDSAIGDEMVQDIVLANLIPATNKQLFRIRVVHEHMPLPNHWDTYTASYTREQANGLTTFTFRGVHTPEPTSTLSILALATLGATLTLKRKLNHSKKTE